MKINVHRWKTMYIEGGENTVHTCGALFYYYEMQSCEYLQNKYIYIA